MSIIYFSPSSLSFYDSDEQSIPSDAVEVSEELANEILGGVGLRTEIAADENGFPVLVELPAPPDSPKVRHIKKLRERSYRRISDPVFFKYQRGDATKEEWLESIASVKARFPINE